MGILTFKNHKTAELVRTIAYSVALLAGIGALIVLIFG
jgi:hypothetical protein